MKEIASQQVENVKKPNNFLHPKSRKCIALKKKLNKQSKKEKNKQLSRFKQTLVAEKLLWFQKHMDPNICPYTVEATALLIEKYIARNDDELEQIEIKRSIGGNRNQQHANREDAIRLTKEREREDYENYGIEIPNILDPVQCGILKKWNGDLNFLPNFKLCNFNTKFLHKKLSLQQNSKKEIIKQKIYGNRSKLKKGTSNTINLKTSNQGINSTKEITEMDVV